MGNPFDISDKKPGDVYTDIKFTCVVCHKAKLIHELGMYTTWGDCCSECIHEALRRYILSQGRFFIPSTGDKPGGITDG